MGNEEVVEINFDEVIKETALAYLIRIDEDEIWLPKSQCDMDQAGHVVDIPEWLALDKDLI